MLTLQRQETHRSCLKCWWLITVRTHATRACPSLCCLNSRQQPNLQRQRRCQHTWSSAVQHHSASTPPTACHKQCPCRCQAPSICKDRLLHRHFRHRHHQGRLSGHRRRHRRRFRPQCTRASQRLSRMPMIHKQLQTLAAHQTIALVPCRARLRATTLVPARRWPQVLGQRSHGHMVRDVQLDQLLS